MHRLAGTIGMVIGPARRRAPIHELRQAAAASPLKPSRHPAAVDPVLVEGFRRDGPPKPEIDRAALGKRPRRAGRP